MLFAQRLESDVLADIAVEDELNTRFGEIVCAALNDFFFQLEARNAIDQQAANTVIPVIDSDLIALAAQLFCSGEAARACADNTNALRPLARGLDGLHPAFFPGGVGDVFLDSANGDGAMAGLFDDTAAFAQTVLRADATTDFRHVVCGRRDLIGFFQTIARCKHEPVGNIVPERAMLLTERHAAL